MKYDIDFLKRMKSDKNEWYIEKPVDWKSRSDKTSEKGSFEKYLEKWVRENLNDNVDNPDYLYDESDSTLSDNQYKLIDSILSTLVLEAWEIKLLSDIKLNRSYTFKESKSLNSLRERYIKYINKKSNDR